MVSEAVLARIADNPKLPTPPALTLRVIERANGPNCSIAEIGKLISVDPAMCSKILRLVNSSLYGLHRPVTSIDRALNLLGLKHVRSLVLSLSLPSLRVQHASAEQMKGYWKSSVTLAIFCRELATRLKWKDADSEMVAGLLCDFGVLLLQETFPDQSALIAAAPPEVRITRQCELEVEHIGVDHAEAGAFFLDRWRLAADLTEPIRFHHRPADAPPVHAQRAAMLFLATRVAQLQDRLDRSAALDEILTLAKDRYRIDSKDFLAFLESLHGKIDEFASLLELDLGPQEAFADLVAKSTENLTRLAVEASLDSFRVQEEKSQVERQLQEAKEALRASEQQLWQAQKMEAVGRLAGGIAHDFNNLLSVIIGSCDLLVDIPTLDAEAHELVDMIKESGTRAANLTRQLLAFSRKQRFVPEVIDLNAVIANMTKLVRRLIGDDVQLLTALKHDLAPVNADVSQIEQVILNLAVNARDAMPGGGCLRIETFNLQLGDDFVAKNPDVVPGRYAVIAVRDTGDGIDEAILAKIFEPFFTTKEQGKGTGLGLATVHGIVRQSGGHITVSSTPGQGAVFHVYLPVAVEPLASPKPTPVADDHIGKAGTVLLVEDEDGVREMMRRALSAQGHTVLTARNGAEALDVHKRHADTIDLVLSDKTMPGMTGHELIQHLVVRQPAMKAILVSGYTDTTQVARSEIDWAMPYLQKPFSTQELTALVREVLANSDSSAVARKEHAS